MPDLTLRDIEPELIEKLKQRAEENCQSIEAEHRQILREALLETVTEQKPKLSFEEHLLAMPNVGSDDDFQRITGAMREINLDP